MPRVPDTSGTNSYQDVRSIFGRNLRSLRRDAGLTLDALAKDIGSSTSTLSTVERGDGARPPSPGMTGRFIDRCLESWAAGRALKDERRGDLQRQYKLLADLFELEPHAVSQLPSSAVTALPMVREHTAVDRPLEHLGQHNALRRLGEPGAHPLALRVHESIPLDPQWNADGLDPDLPTFVERDVGEQIRQWMRSARTDGGFLILVGDSSVGKTRLLYETARDVLHDFPVLAPDLGDGSLVNTLAAVSIRPPGLIVWLDELQRFLPGPYFVPSKQARYAPITVAAIRQLLTGDTPVIFVGTLWPEYAAQLRATHRNPTTGTEGFRYQHAVDILSIGIRDISLHGFSSTERATAKLMAEDDPRLAVALDDQDYNVTEALSGCRQMVRRYDQATEPQRTLLHAAVDARRVGIQGVLTEEMLRAASRGYLRTIHADDSWFCDALAELTNCKRPHDKATAPLVSVPNVDKTEAVGFILADYLQQRLVRRRRTERLPEATWRAFAEHTDNLDDLARLAESAYNRMLYRHAEPLIRRLTEIEDKSGYWSFGKQLAHLLAWQGKLEELCACADAGNSSASALYAKLLMERGDIGELRERAKAGDWFATRRLPQLLAEQGHLDEAISYVRAHAAADDPIAVYQLADLLAKQGHIEEAIALLHSILNRPEDDEDTVGSRLADILAEQQRIDELRELADSGNWSARWRLVDILLEQGKLDELYDRARNGDDLAIHQYTQAFVNQNRIEDALAFLSNCANAGSEAAKDQYARLLAAHDRGPDAIAYLRAHGGDNTRSLLADLLAEQGSLDQALAVLPTRPRDDSNDLFDRPWPIELTEFHARHSLLDELRVDADDGVDFAANLLVETLAEQGRLDELRAEVDAGTPNAASQLITALEKQGRTWEADALRMLGLNPDGTVAAATKAQIR